MKQSYFLNIVTFRSVTLTDFMNIYDTWNYFNILDLITRHIYNKF